MASSRQMAARGIDATRGKKINSAARISSTEPDRPRVLSRPRRCAQANSDDRSQRTYVCCMLRRGSFASAFAVALKCLDQSGNGEQQANGCQGNRRNTREKDKQCGEDKQYRA